MEEESISAMLRSFVTAISASQDLEFSRRELCAVEALSDSNGKSGHGSLRGDHQQAPTFVSYHHVASKA